MKLMIIDDDIQIREGIQEGVDWESLAISHIKSYGDALRALDDLELFSPDIIISDVRMPGMDGLEFLKTVKEKHPEIKIIMISAYSDFAYLKKAIEHGAQDYELKPLKFSKLISIMQKTVKIIKQERAQVEQYNEYYNQYKLHVMQGILTGKEELQGKNLRVMQQEIPISPDAYHLCLTLQIIVSKDLHPETLYLLFKTALQDEFSYHLLNTFFIEQDQHIVIYLRFNNDIAAAAIASVRTSIQALQTRLGKHNLKISGAAAEVFSLEDSVLAYQETCQLLKHTAYLGAGSLAYRGDVNPVISGDIALLEETEVQVIQAFITYNRDLLIKSIRSIGSYFYSHRDYQQFGYRKIFLNCCIQIMNQKGIKNVFDVDKEAEKISTFFYLEDVIEYWIDLYTSSMERLKSYELSNYSNMIIKALDYIHAHFRENITVADVAEYIKKSPNYFSSTFKKELGASFPDYVNSLRINEAERLIREENSYIYEVAYQVGYKDYSYFYQVFKRIKGYEPTLLKK